MLPLDPTSFALPFKLIGDSGMRTADNGSLIIKPAFPAELEFYETLMQNPYLGPLQPFIPKFLGTIPANNQTWGSFTIPPGRTKHIILENLCKGFVKPNTLDVKLGTVFHDALMSPDKISRAEKTARETTSLETGIRLAEFQVYDNITSEPISTSKSYGKAMKSYELPDGIAQFFPVHGDCHGSRDNGSLTRGVPRGILLRILRGIRQEVLELQRIYSNLEIRIVGGSLLIVYEADWTRAEGPKVAGAPTTLENGVDAESSPTYIVKLVDFAHTRLALGEGPDEGVLLGLNTMLRLLDGRIAQVTDS